MIENIYCFIWGSIIKIYDDLCSDNHIITNSTAKEVLKGLIFIMSTIIFMNNFNFCLLMYIILISAAIVDIGGFNTPFEASGMLLFPLFLMIGFHTRKSINIMDILCLICICTVCFIEPNIENKVDVSKNKLIIRSIITLHTIFNIYTMPIIVSYTNISDFWLKGAYASTGYHLFSCFFQIYSLYIKKDTNELKEEPNELKEETNELKEEPKEEQKEQKEYPEEHIKNT